MFTIVSQISDYFEQFNSSITADLKSISPSAAPISNEKTPLQFYTFDFERHFDQGGTFHDLRVFMIQRWHNSFFYALAYLFLIYSKLMIVRWKFKFCFSLFSAGQIYMKNKPKFELRLWLAAWNMLLAAFSIFGAMRVLPELIYVIYRHGIKYSICNNSNAFGVVGFW